MLSLPLKNVLLRVVNHLLQNNKKCIILTDVEIIVILKIFISFITFILLFKMKSSCFISMYLFQFFLKKSS